MARSHALVGSEKHVIVPFSSGMTVQYVYGGGPGALGRFLAAHLVLTLVQLA